MPASRYFYSSDRFPAGTSNSVKIAWSVSSWSCVMVATLTLFYFQKLVKKDKFVVKKKKKELYKVRRELYFKWRNFWGQFRVTNNNWQRILVLQQKDVSGMNTNFTAFTSPIAPDDHSLQLMIELLFLDVVKNCKIQNSKDIFLNARISHRNRVFLLMNQSYGNCDKCLLLVGTNQSLCSNCTPPMTTQTLQQLRMV